MSTLSAMLLILCVWAFSKPRSSLEYMVGGTLSTSILLAGAFVYLVRRGMLRTGGASFTIRRTATGHIVRRSVQSS